MIGHFKLKLNISKNKKRIFIFLLTFIFVYGTLLTTLMTKRYDLKVGDIANTDIKAPREIEDKKETEIRQQEVADKVDKQYSLKTDVQKQGQENIQNFFQKLISIKESSSSDSDKISALKKVNDKLDNEQCKELLASSKEQISDMQSVLLDTIAKIYANPIEEDKLSDVQNAKAIVDTKVMSLDYSRNIKLALQSLAYAQIKPNFFFDKEKTDEKIKEAIKNVTPIMYKKNQLIVKEGTPVTEDQVQILSELGLLNDSNTNIFIFLMLGIFVGCILCIQYSYLYKMHREIYNDVSKVILISIINCTALILARTVSIISPFVIPLACAPILITLLIDYRVSMVLSSINCILIAACVGFAPEIIILALLNAVLGATIIRRMQQRNDILYITVYLAIISAIITLSAGVLISNNLREVFLKASLSVLASILSGILAVGLLPFFENSFDVVTTVKLLELSNPNNPLLKKLLMEAPGTYHHSMLVANLAEMAAEEVGGNPVLARIGAYYHDIGKTKRPIFFRENQMTKENPHDRISPNLSASIIISHVKDGLEMAKEYNLPQAIQDIIEQHHGNTLVKYFYITMKNNSENPDDVKEEDFRYTGRTPEGKEAGIIMLADSVEAAVRSINEPTKEKIEQMVNNIINDKLNSGQLDNCELTFRDLNKIKKCFLKALNGIYHQRIEYPTENKKKEIK